MKYFFSFLLVLFSMLLVSCSDNDESGDPDKLSEDELKEIIEERKNQMNEDLVVVEDQQEIFPEDFVVVCDLKSVDGASVYDSVSGDSDNGADVDHPVYLFARNVGSEPYVLQTDVLPAGWSVSWEHSAETQLVACLDLTEKNVNKGCDYQVSGQKYRLELMNAVYNVNLFEAATGKILASESIELDGKDECPDEAVFDKNVKWDLPDYTEKLEEFLEEHVKD